VNLELSSQSIVRIIRPCISLLLIIIKNCNAVVDELPCNSVFGQDLIWSQTLETGLVVALEKGGGWALHHHFHYHVWLGERRYARNKYNYTLYSVWVSWTTSTKPEMFPERLMNADVSAK